MQKLKTFFHVFKNSLIKPIYYKDVLKAPFSFSLKYFLFFFFTLSFLNVVIFSFFLIQKVHPYIERIKTQAPQFYPAELTITIKNGQVSTNVSQPYFIPIKPELFPEELGQVIKQQPIQNILVIDTLAEPSEIKKYQTFALLTKDSIAFIANRNEIRIQSLEEIKDFTLNRQIIKEAWQQVIPYLRWIIPGVIIILFLTIPFLTIMIKFFYLVVFSLLSWILVKIMKLGINYAKVLQINLHAITLPTVIIAIFQSLGADPRIPFFQSTILLFFILIIFTSIKEKTETKE